METKTQLSIFLENRPGTFQRVAESLGEQGINVLGFAVNDAIDHAVVRMVVDDPTKAIHLLEEAGVLVLEAEVLEVQLEVLGSLQKMIRANGTKSQPTHEPIDLSPLREVLAEISASREAVPYVFDIKRHEGGAMSQVIATPITQTIN